jgi:LacI family transcriptional regulator
MKRTKPQTNRQTTPIHGPARKRRVILAYGWIELGHRVGIARYARRAGWILGQIGRGYAFRLRRGQVDGLLCQLHHRSDEDMIREVVGLKVPIVELSDRSPELRAARVMPDLTEAGRTTARHLLQNRFRNFAYVSWQPVTSGPNSLYRGFAQVLHTRRLQAALIAGDALTVRQESRPAAEILAEPFHDRWHGLLRREIGRLPTPLGVFAADFDAAIDVYDVCREMGLLVPEQVSLVTWSQEPEESELTELPFSGFSMDFERQGYEAAAVLDRLMDGKKAPDLTLIPPNPLVVRASSSVVAMPNLTVARALRYIQAQLSNPALCTKQVVSALGSSRTHIYRLFRDHFDRSISAQIKHERLLMATQLLREGKLRVHEIARRCGYSSAIHLTRSIRRQTGVTPREYRRRQRGGASAIH